MHDHDDQVQVNARSNGASPKEELVERADDLLRRAGALREHCEELGERLEALARSVPERPATVPPEPTEGIRIVATNLVLSGADRDEVAARLREHFGDGDTDGLLDEVFAAAGEAPRAGSTRRRFPRKS